jgi:hypothetical protein
MRTAPLLLWSLFSLPVDLEAQSTPETAAEAFGAAIVAQDGARAARLMHPGALRVFRGFLEEAPDASPVTGQLFGVRSAAELAATPDTVLFARLLENSLKQSSAGGVSSEATFKALGHIRLPGDTVLVVARFSFPIDSISISSYELIPTLLYQGSYRTLLKADMSNMLKMLSARFKRAS